MVRIDQAERLSSSDSAISLYGFVWWCKKEVAVASDKLGAFAQWQISISLSDSDLIKC
jgi:hypothetical protein